MWHRPRRLWGRTRGPSSQIDFFDVGFPSRICWTRTTTRRTILGQRGQHRVVVAADPAPGDERQVVRGFFALEDVRGPDVVDRGRLDFEEAFLVEDDRLLVGTFACAFEGDTTGTFDLLVDEVRLSAGTFACARDLGPDPGGA